MANQMSLSNILLKGGKNLGFHFRVQAPIPSAPRKEAPHLHNGEIAYGYRTVLLNVFLHILGAGFIEVPFSEGAGINVDVRAHRASLSSRTSFSLPFRMRGIFFRRSL